MQVCSSQQANARSVKMHLILLPPNCNTRRRITIRTIEASYCRSPPAWVALPIPLARHLAFSSCKWRDMEAVQALRNCLSKLMLQAQDTLDAMEDSQTPQQHNLVL